MGWPKGKSRKPLTADAPTGQTVPSAPKPRMKARPNWEEYDPGEDSEDRLKISADLFPPGFSFQWVTNSVLGQEMPEFRSRFERKGWTPVHQEDFDGVFDGKFMARGKEGEITVDGLVLMARPMEFTNRAKKEEQRKAREAVLIKQQQLTGGEMPGVTLDSRHPSAMRTNKINVTVEPVSIPVPSDQE